MKISKSKAKELILGIIGQVDYDLVKSFEPDTAEDPEYAEETMDELVEFVQKFLSKIK